jgi:ATP-dependent exoDNAse (exonuclease V) beta subunit
MNLRVITASAGSGKTWRLSEVLDQAIADGAARPEGIVATTFTEEAAAELVERARARLLAAGRGREAQALLAARIGTVHAVCGGLVAEYAFELGLSPALRVLDEGSAEIEQKRALAAVVSPALDGELYRLQQGFEKLCDWRLEVRTLIEAARANGLGAAALAASAERSVATLDACLGPSAPDGDVIDADLAAAIDRALAGIHTDVDDTRKTRSYLALLEEARRDLRARRLRWGQWAKLGNGDGPAVQWAALAGEVAAAAARHPAHPRLRLEMARFIRLLFQVAASGLDAYQEHKRQRGLIDFVDQEALALELLRRPDVRAALAGQLDLVLVDEFQDTSPLQLAIFLELAALARDSVWVGDQKQAIYGFRGTDPALMDAVIESLTATSTDPELVRATVEAVGVIESLGVSYRSRPALVDLTSAMFAPAFAGQGIPEERTRLTPASRDEPAGLGPIALHWPLRPDGRANKAALAACVAAAVRDHLAAAPLVRAAGGGAARQAGPADLAVLCRTNEQCREVAEALATLGVPAVVPRMRLLDTGEGQAVLAGLRLWVDPGDALAAAELARLGTFAADLDGLVTRALAEPGRAAFAADPPVAALLGERARDPDRGPAAATATVIDALGLRELAAAWGGAAQRHANLDALLGRAVAYAREAEAGQGAATVAGLVRDLEESAEDGGFFGAARSDRQALLAGAAAVTVSTWHRAKGREWPITVLYGLETLRGPAAVGLHVVTDQNAFDLGAPLDGRWLRYWPNPYTTANQGGPVKDAFALSPAFADVVARNRREVLRLLYVGWTRARDQVILAAEEGKLEDGLFGALVDAGPGLFAEPRPAPTGPTPVTRRVTWGRSPLDLTVRAGRPAAPAPRPSEPGEVTLGRAPAEHAPARLSPSMAPPVPCVVGAPVRLGPRLAVRGQPDFEWVGRAVHAFLAADRPGLDEAERLALAGSLLARHGVSDALSSSDIVASATRLWGWVDSLGPARVHREWPVHDVLASGAHVAGAADLVVVTAAGLVVVDHKTFPGTLEQALARVSEYSGQLAAYARALGAPVAGTWIHLPVLGLLIELNVGEPTS